MKQTRPTSLAREMLRVPTVSSSPIDEARILVQEIPSKKAERVADQGRTNTTVDVRMSPPECNRHIGRQGAIGPRGCPPSFAQSCCLFDPSVQCQERHCSGHENKSGTDRAAVIPSLDARLLSALLLHVLVVEDDQLRRVEAREDQLVAIGHDVEPDHDIGHWITEAVDIVVIVLF